MYIVKKEKTNKIAAVFKDKEEATHYVVIGRCVKDLPLYIVEDPAITEEIYDKIYDEAIIDILMDPDIITDRIPDSILKTIEIIGGMKDEIK